MTVAVGCFSRNNSRLFEDFFIPTTLSAFDNSVIKFNIEDFSDEEHKARSIRACDREEIYYMENETRGLQFSVDRLSDVLHILDPSVKWAIVFQTDCYLLPGHAMEFVNQLESGRYDSFGMVGANIAAEDIGGTHPDHHEESILKHGARPHLALARCPITVNPEIFWYRPEELPMTDIGFPVDQPFAVEIPNWMVTAINLPLFRKHINKTNKYHMIFAWDDIAMQFLAQNVYNVAIPWIYGSHRPFLKTNFGLPTASSVEAWKRARQGDSEGEKMMGNADHHAVWRQRWGWDYENKSSFKSNSLLMDEFRGHDLHTGPLRVF